MHVWITGGGAALDRSPSSESNERPYTDHENRLTKHRNAGTITTYTYGVDGLKRSEKSGSSVTTLVWDGDDYLQARI